MAAVSVCPCLIFCFFLLLLEIIPSQPLISGNTSSHWDISAVTLLGRALPLLPSVRSPVLVQFSLFAFPLAFLVTLMLSLISVWASQGTQELTGRGPVSSSPGQPRRYRTLITSTVATVWRFCDFVMLGILYTVDLPCFFRGTWT